VIRERPPPGPVRPGAADLDLAAVDPQLDPACGGIGEHVSQRGKPRALRGGVAARHIVPEQRTSSADVAEAFADEL